MKNLDYKHNPNQHIDCDMRVNVHNYIWSHVFDSDMHFNFNTILYMCMSVCMNDAEWIQSCLERLDVILSSMYTT